MKSVLKKKEPKKIKKTMFVILQANLNYLSNAKVDCCQKYGKNRKQKTWKNKSRNTK